LGQVTIWPSVLHATSCTDSSNKTPSRPISNHSSPHLPSLSSPLTGPDPVQRGGQGGGDAASGRPRGEASCGGQEVAERRGWSTDGQICAEAAPILSRSGTDDAHPLRERYRRRPSSRRLLARCPWRGSLLCAVGCPRAGSLWCEAALVAAAGASPFDHHEVRHRSPAAPSSRDGGAELSAPRSASPTCRPSQRHPRRGSWLGTTKVLGAVRVFRWGV
jgi:hypothetical protein